MPGQRDLLRHARVRPGPVPGQRRRDQRDGDGDPTSTTGDGDGDPTTTGDGDGDPTTTGDGDGDPNEVVVVDLYAEACGITARWISFVSSLETMIPCDQPGDLLAGWMERFDSLELGPQSFPKVISLVTAPTLDAEVRGYYNVDDVSNVLDLEFRAEVAIRCPMGDTECAGRFNLAFHEGTANGLYAVFDDRDLLGFTAPVPISVSLAGLATFSNPEIVLSAQRTDASADASPELIIINPRLVLP